MTSTSLQDRVAIVTGAGAGLGRAEALELARAGAAVVVNDYSDAAHETVADIEALGGQAIAVTGDVSTWATGEELVATALDRFGTLDIVVNNAGVVRDRMLFNMSESEWDTVLAVHLKGHFILSRLAAAHWRAQSKAAGAPVYGRIVNTASEAAFNGGPGQPNYSAAKAGIVSLTVSTARGCGQYGVTANAICPRARTAMTSDVFAPVAEGEVDLLSTDQVTPLVAYLVSPAAAGISAQVFVVHSGKIVLMAPPAVEQMFGSAGTWSVAEVGEQVGGYFTDRDPSRIFSSKPGLDRV